MNIATGHSIPPATAGRWYGKRTEGGRPCQPRHTVGAPSGTVWHGSPRQGRHMHLLHSAGGGPREEGMQRARGTGRTTPTFAIPGGHSQQARVGWRCKGECKRSSQNATERGRPGDEGPRPKRPILGAQAPRAGVPSYTCRFLGASTGGPNSATASWQRTRRARKSVFCTAVARVGGCPCVA